MTKQVNTTKLAKNSLHTVDILSLGLDGQGIAKIEGKTVFVRGALPGESAKIKIIFDRPKFSAAITEEILIPSKERAAPPCPHFFKCGGCDLQHLSYEGQETYKKEYILGFFKDILADFKENIRFFPSKEYRYRNKLSMPVREENGVKIGFYAKNSHRLVSIDDCLLQREWNKDIIAALKDYISQSEEAALSADGTGNIRQLVVREAGGHKYITVVSKAGKIKKPEILIKKLRQLYGDSFALYLNTNKDNTNVVFGDDFKFLGGTDPCIIMHSLKLKLHPAAFLQTNDFICGQLYDAAIESASGEVIIDAYSGAGLMTAMLSKKASTIGIEINKAAHNSALTLKKDNNLDFLPLLGDCSALINKLLDKHKDKQACVVLDPPRSGCDSRVIAALNKYRPHKIIYISCNPATLKRDLLLLNEYKINDFKLFDMFPQTGHIECMVALCHK